MSEDKARPFTRDRILPPVNKYIDIEGIDRPIVTRKFVVDTRRGVLSSNLASQC